MPDAPVVTPPASTQAAAPPAPAAAKKDEPKPYRFKFTPGPSFSVDGFLMSGSLEGTVHISEQLTVTLRTLSVDANQKAEAAVNVQDQAHTIKFLTNEMTIEQNYHAIQAMNGKSIPPIPQEYWSRDPKDYKPETDLRRKWLRNLPGIIFDQITIALGEFERHAKEIVSPESVRNF